MRTIILGILVLFPLLARGDARPLSFYYLDFSAFHGDGAALWVTEDGEASLQTAQNNRSRIFQFTLPRGEWMKIRGELSELPADRMKVVDRNGISDEVRVRVGFRDASRKLRQLSLWEGDWGNQPPEIRKLSEIAAVFLKASASLKPLREKEFSPGKLVIERPNTILSSDVEAVLGR